MPTGSNETIVDYLNVRKFKGCFICQTYIVSDAIFIGLWIMDYGLWIIFLVIVINIFNMKILFMHIFRGSKIFMRF